MGSKDILKMNCNLFTEMKELAEKLEKLISDDQMDEFNKLLDQREHIQKEITANIRKHDAESKNILHKKQDQKAIKIKGEISEVIKSIQETDKKIEGLIISKKDIFLNDIKNLRKGGNAIRSYRGAKQKVNKFLDRRG